jgi:peptidyl-prolyl cis-trans isomerase SurA
MKVLMIRASALALSFGFLLSCNRSAPANVAANVNGRSITYADLDKQFRSQFGDPGDKANDDQTSIQRLEVLRTLIDNEVMLQRSEKMGRREVQRAQGALYARRVPEAACPAQDDG